MFKPLTAYVAGLAHDGTLISADALSNPTVYPTVVVEFELDDDLYRAIYHHRREVWEFPDWLGSAESRMKFDSHLVVADGWLFDSCEKTLAEFQSKIFEAPKADRFRDILADKMAKSIQEEIDADILKSINVACATTVTSIKPSATFQLALGQPAGIEPRKLMARWTMDKIDDVLSMMPRLVSKIYPDVAV